MENRTFLINLLDILENAKSSLSSEAAMQNDAAASSYIIQFAMKLFLAADNEERSGQTSKKTVRLFVLASQFLQLLEDVGGIPLEIEDKIKYAKYKAIEITKKESESETRNDSNVNKNEIEDANSKKISHSNAAKPFSPPPPPPAIITPSSLPSYSGSFVNFEGANPIISSLSSPSSNIIISSMAWNEAEKHARYAISAIQFEDRETAIKELEKSLTILSNKM